MTTEPPDHGPLMVVLRVPPWQTAAAFLVAALCAGLAIYADLAALPRLALFLVGLGAALSGVVAARAYLVADQAGIGLRRVMRETSIPWARVTSVEVIVKKNQPAIYIFQDGAQTVRVPSFLSLPLKPTTGPTAARNLDGLANRIRQVKPAA